MTLLGDVIFWVLGATAVLSGAAVFWVNSMARATYALAISFVAVGLQLLLLDQAYPVSYTHLTLPTILLV